jgi:hypothetical protein
MVTTSLLFCGFASDVFANVFNLSIKVGLSCDTQPPLPFPSNI